MLLVTPCPCVASGGEVSQDLVKGPDVSRSSFYGPVLALSAAAGRVWAAAAEWRSRKVIARGAAAPGGPERAPPWRCPQRPGYLCRPDRNHQLRLDQPSWRGRTREAEFAAAAVHRREGPLGRIRTVSSPS